VEGEGAAALGAAGEGGFVDVVAAGGAGGFVLREEAEGEVFARGEGGWIGGGHEGSYNEAGARDGGKSQGRGRSREGGRA